MKLKKALILALAVLFAALVAGCENTPPEVNPKYGEITDPGELEELWQEYLYDSIATVGNTRQFNSAREIDPLNVAKFCWCKYVNEHGKESLALAGEDSTLRLFPLDTVLKYAERYFNLTSLDVSTIEDSYDPQKRAFLFNFGSERTRPAYNADNAWDICLNKVTRNNDGTLTVVLVRKGPPQSGRIELTKTYTLKQREDGSLFFVSGRWDFVNNHLVSLTGDYQYYTEITGFAGNMEELAMLGEVDGQPLLANTPYEKGKTASLLLLNPETMHVEKQLDLQAKFEATDVRLTDKIVVCLKDKIITIDQALEETKDLPLPPAIKAKMERNPEYDQYGIPDIFFGGYDVSRDLKTIVYADEIGVKLFNIADNSEKLLAPSVLIKGSKFFNKSHHRHPRFVDHEQKVITIMTAYEGTLGYTLCDLAAGTAKTYDISSESSSTGCIRYDSGLLEVNTHLYNREKQTAECKTLYLDFRTGEIKEITLEDPGDTNDIRWPEHCYVGQDYAAFITRKWDSSDPAQSMFYLNRINLKTLQLEPKIVSVKAAQTYILGVLADGRILFWYNLNPSENGVCLTK